MNVKPMLIKKVGSNIVHAGYIPHDYYSATSSPTRCNQSGWHNVWVSVIKIKNVQRKCVKCFGKEGDA